MPRPPAILHRFDREVSAAKHPAAAAAIRRAYELHKAGSPGAVNAWLLAAAACQAEDLPRFEAKCLDAHDELVRKAKAGP